MHDLKDYRESWWTKEVIYGITWNHVILGVIVFILIISYDSLDWNWVFGLR